MRRLANTARVLAALSLAILTSAARPIGAQEDSLYDRLGGMPSIEAVVEQTIVNVVADDRINHFFANADPERLRLLLVELICAGTGGPCTYTGRSMQEAHAGMGITEGDFMALVEDLAIALDSLGVPEGEKDELLGVLGPMQADVVQAPAMAPPAPPAVVAPAPQPPAVVAPPAPPPQPAPARASVAIRDFRFQPPTLTVAIGSTVTWTNSDAATHTATGQGFDAGTMGSGQAGSTTFATAGQFNYRCNIHPNMQGTIVVQ